MKKAIFILAFSLGLLNCAKGQQLTDILLDEPDMERGTNVSRALMDRQSVREYSERDLSIKDLSDLLWSANGYNRPAEQKRTAGTAMNTQEIDIYVAMKSGVYLYDVQRHILRHISTEDVRSDVAAGQDFAAEAPVSIIIVADLSRDRNGNTEAAKSYSAYDAGIVSQNISLFCAGNGMGTVCRGTMDKGRLAAALGLGENHMLHLNHPVGYLK